ncbi:MAG: hypothetical protein ACRDQA_31560 [Nocardioidaceae bacterium]
MGAFPGAKGLPHITARVEYAGSGYDALFGWVQLVRSTDNESGGRGFEMDPFALFPDAPSPYCFFGFEPILFDAPARDTRPRMDWLAHSFLAYSPLEAEARQVVPLLGFSWSFEIDDRAKVTIRAVERLQVADWTAHADLLETTYPDWQFASGFG